MDAFTLVSNCSNHFSKDCFEYGSETEGTYKVPKLKKDKYCVSLFSNIHGYTVEKDSDHAKCMKQRRTVCLLLYCKHINQI